MNILITGAGGSLGKACVQEFLKKGHHVIAILSPGKKLDAKSESSSTYNANLTDEEDTHKTIKQIISDHGQIDIALLLVGGFAMGSIKETNSAQVKKMIELNFNTTFHVAQKIFKQMTKQKNGRLVFIGAKPSLEPKAGKGLIAYALSKTLIFKLAELLNEEGKDNNVAATVIVPSVIDTEANRKAMPKVDPNNWVKPEEIAEIIEFATSEKGSKLREPILKIYGNA
jgi:NAD(P)-dependent dehydrogenase (short-subunit alcohol dehydrogenase family)